VLNVLVTGTIGIFTAAFLLLLVSLAENNSFVLARAINVAIGLLAAVGAYYLSRSGRFRAAAYVLIALYSLLATGVIYRWGVTVPPGILLYGLVLTLSGMLLGGRTIPYTFGIVVGVMTIVRTLQVNDIVHPDWSSWAQQPLNFGTILGCWLLFGILATVSSLYTSQMERSLERARRAEAALRRQKQLLEVTVEKRTRQLQDAQLEKVQQMYRFAELGQLSTALLHDLANHLTTLSLDIEGLEEQNRSRMLQRAKRSIRYIDDMVARVRDQLHGRANIRPFNVATEIEEIVTIMNHRAQDAHVRLRWERPADKRGLRVRGEPIRFRQLMANLVSNAIDAYDPENAAGPREVLITAKTDADEVIITVNDWGGGIAADDRVKLFEPFFSTKKTGMGMGLFIAKQIAEEHFTGQLRLDAKKKHTVFVLTLARE
jgi:C4-dicarboxylate-specific signal transduction histidine kinase